MPRSITKRRRTGKYNCKLYTRARMAEAKYKLISDAHERCINEREWRIKMLTAKLSSLSKLFVAAVNAAGGSIEVDFEKANKFNERDVSITQTGDDTFTYKYIGDDAKTNTGDCSQ